MITLHVNKIIANSIVITTVPAVKAETHIKFVDGSEGDYLLEGNVDWQYLVGKGLVRQDSGTPPTWIKPPQEVNFGSAVTSVGEGAFYQCTSLTSVTIPDSVTSIGNDAFSSAPPRSVTFSGKDKATVQGMANYSWGINSHSVLHCTDGDITL